MAKRRASAREKKITNRAFSSPLDEKERIRKRKNISKIARHPAPKKVCIAHLDDARNPSTKNSPSTYRYSYGARVNPMARRP